MIKAGFLLFVVSVVGLLAVVMVSRFFGPQRAYGMGYYRASAELFWTTGILYLLFGLFVFFRYRQ